MPQPIYIDFMVRNMPEVQRAFVTIQDTVTASENATTRAVRSGSSAKEREYRKLAADAARWEREKLRATQRAEAEAARAVARAEREKTQMKERSATTAGRLAAQQAAAESRAAEQAARDKIRAMQRTDAAVKRIQEQAVRDAARTEQRKDAEAQRWVRTRERQNEQAAVTRRRAVGGAVTNALSSGAQAGFRTATRGIQSVAGMTMSLGGNFSVADSIQRGSALQRHAAELAASTDMAGDGARKIGSGEILSNARAIAMNQAMDPAEVLRGFEEVKKLTGDLDKAMAIMPEVAKLATATGGKVSEMSGLAGNILASNPNMSTKDLKDQLRVFTKQGLVGGVEVSDFAKYGGRITAGASLFGGDHAKNLATMGAIAQISRQYGGAASPAEAAMASQRFATDVASHSATLAKHGIDVSDKHGNLKDAQTILAEMVDKTGGDVTKLKTMGLGERGVRALTGVSAIYKNAGGGDAGKKAVEQEFKKYTTGVTDKEVNAANTMVLAGADAKMARVREEFDRAVSEKLVPKLLEMVPVIERTIPAFIDLTSQAIPAFVELGKTVSDFANANRDSIAFLASHPIGAVMIAETTKSIAGAGIGAAIQKGIASQIGGTAGLTIAAATMAVAVGTIVIDKAADDLNKKRNKEVSESMQGFSEAKFLERQVREGNATPHDVERLRSMRDAMASSVDEQKANVNTKSWTEKIGWFLGGDSGIGKMLGASGDESKEYQRAREQQLAESQKTLNEMNRALAEAAKNVQAFGNAARTAAPGVNQAARDTGMIKRN